jgi:hypothetical protein
MFGLSLPPQKKVLGLVLALVLVLGLEMRIKKKSSDFCRV